MYISILLDVSVLEDQLFQNYVDFDDQHVPDQNHKLFLLFHVIYLVLDA